MKSLLTCFATASLILASWQTAAQTPAPAQTDYMEAGARMEQRIAQQSAMGDMPRIAEPETQALLDILSDRQRFLDSQTYAASNLGQLMEICGQANRVTMAYVLSGFKDRIDPKATQEQIVRQMIRTMEENTLSFQQELEQLHPFLMRCLATQIPPMAGFMATLPPQELTPVRLAGLKQLRGGLLSSYIGHLQSINNPAYRVSYRKQLLRAMAENSHLFASALQLQARQQIVDAAGNSLAEAPTEDRTDIEAIIVSMRDVSCTGLCAY